MNRVLIATFALVALAAPVASLGFGGVGEAASPPKPLSPRPLTPSVAGPAAQIPPSANALSRAAGARGTTVVGRGVTMGATPASTTTAAQPAVPGPPPPGAIPGAAGLADPKPADPLAAWGRPPAPQVDPRRFTEAHWQGLEVVPNTPTLAKMLRLPPDLPGVIVDDVTLPADLQGFKAGDVVMRVGSAATPDLLAFIDATQALRAQPSADVVVWRAGAARSTKLVALRSRLGNANGETPSMIPPNARMPHPYRGPCTNCHRIGTTGTLAVDQGDPMPTVVPDIRVGAVRPHEDRGPCNVCHRILQ